MAVHIIFYVNDQDRSTGFYQAVLGCDPRLNVPGMTEFELSEGIVLGLMPEKGIKKLLGDSIPDPSKGNRIPRAELYLEVDDAQAYHHRALECGGRECLPLGMRDWGQAVAYSLDIDGYVLAFAQK